MLSRPGSLLRKPLTIIQHPAQRNFAVPQDYRDQMKQFAETTLKMEYNIVEQGLVLDQNCYQTSFRKPSASPFMAPFFDFSTEALRNSQGRGVHYLILASFYGTYYYGFLAPHSMYFVGCTGISFFMFVGFLNYQMTMALTVADAQVKADGENARVILYNGKQFDVPIKDMTWFGYAKDKCTIEMKDGRGKWRRAVFDFSKVRPQSLVNKELCMAILHPEVHRIAWNE